MTMQAALEAALRMEARARPASIPIYTYRWERHGRELMLHVSARDRRGQVQDGFWRTLTKREVDSEWIVCDADGRPLSVTLPQEDGSPQAPFTLKSLL